MSSPNSNSADMNSWLAKANAAQFTPSREFGNPSAESEQENPSDQGVSGAGRDVSSDGSLDDSN
jgi:hypothetical protein